MKWEWCRFFRGIEGDQGKVTDEGVVELAAGMLEEIKTTAERIPTDDILKEIGITPLQIEQLRKETN